MLFAATIFVSAFLLFQVQPLVARVILPWFGGSAAVWTTCMLFFQVLLVGGYLYSHWLTQRKPRTQSLVHIALLVVSLVTLPIAPDPAWKPNGGGGDPTLRIIALLALSVGLPYFLLSTTSPLVQSWYARAKSGVVPYRLFALSNFGSMLALLSYPVVVEPLLPIRAQAIGWSAGFVAFVVLCGLLAWASRDLPRESVGARSQASAAAPAQAPGAGDYAMWIALPACASVLLLAFTSHLSTNVAPIPFLWVLPLALYLLSFILCFEGHGWYRRIVFLPLLAIGLGLVAWTLYRDNLHLRLALMIPIYALTLFIACMVCHGELVRAQPHPRYLTMYYVMISVGGALGGLFVSMFAPALFTDLWELPLGMLATVIAVIAALAREKREVPGAVPTWVVMGCAMAGGALAWFLHQSYAERAEDAVIQVRNFYAALRVEEYGEAEKRQRLLMHGTITHGRQYLAPERRGWATSYYSEGSGVGRAIRARQSSGPVRIGVIGLGTGTLASYGRAGDTVRIYEINPQVIDLARRQFSYLGDSKATVETALGDARLVLEREAAQGFDVLAVDAFSSDAIPVHLLTTEAVGVYFRHLKRGGILAVHISNRYLDLEPVLAEAALAHAKVARIVENEDDADKGIYTSTWVLLADDEAAFGHAELAAAKPLAPERKVKRWTDDYSDLYSILK